MRRALAAGVLMLAVSQSAGGQAAALRFEVAVAPQAARHLRLLEYPPYLAAALENSGVKPSNASRITFVDGRTLRFRNANLAFEGVEGTRYRYRVKMQWNAGMGDVSYDLPVFVDARHASEGRVELVVEHPGSGLLPASLTDRIGLKLQSLASPASQAAVLRYLETLPTETSTGMQPALERILIDSYNLSMVASMPGRREPGDAEPLQDQLYLIATVLIWLVAVPAAFYRARRLRARRDPG